MAIQETFQQTFASTIAELVITAYNSGVLQHHPMTIAGITVTMDMYTHFNQLAVQLNGNLMNISLFDTDSDELNASAIKNLLADIIVKG